jgi:hypothetical protein
LRADARRGMGEKDEGTSFSEEKEAKRLLSV